MLKKNRNYRFGKWVYVCVILTACAVLYSGCTTPKKIRKKTRISKKIKRVKPTPAPKLEIPDFAPVTEDLSPLRTRIVNISARSTPLRDVLHIIAETSALNLVMERGVDPDTPVTMTIKDINVEDALNTIFAAVDYFYTVKNNMIIIKAVDTRVFEIGHPAILQTYTVGVGGDILSGALSAAGGGGGIQGKVNQTIRSDSTAFDFWSTMEQSITSIIEGSPSTDEGVQESIIVNRMTGTVFVTATKKNIERVERFINTVKKVISRQVMIEARIIEVQLTESMKFGIDWNMVAGGSLGGISNELTLGQSFSSAVNAALPAFGVGLTAGNITSVVKALQQQGDVKTLSNPRVSILNGQTSLLSVGRAQNFVSQVNTTVDVNGNTTFSVSTGNILSGIVLGIVPFINEVGEISMTITPIISSLVKLENISVGSASNKTQLSLPTVDLRELSTTIKVRDGQLVVIGGLISETDTEDQNKVPLLSDLPGIGGLFKSKNRNKTKTELVVLLLPKIIS